MKLLKRSRKALALLTISLLAVPALADPISITQSQDITASGQNFTFDFLGLPQSDGSGGLFSFFARGDYTDPVNETALVTLDLLGGVLQLNENGVLANTIAGLSLFANNTISDPGGGTDQILDFVFNLSGALLDTLLADGIISVGVDNSGSVTAVGNPDHRVEVSFSYETGAVAVPEPGTLTLFGLGVLGLALGRRRKTA